MQRNIDDALPLRFAHAGQWRVVVTPALLTTTCTGPRAAAFDRAAARVRVGDVERDGLRAAAGVEDVRDHGFGAAEVAVGVDDGVEAVRGEATADRAAGAAAAAGDERASRCVIRHGIALVVPSPPGKVARSAG